ncbi:MAG TPA: hypothetical protein VFQ53_19165 [Kofleriaceae bacterium]|nr:hypothetical protein [Kofleriaceae bacterium]
MTRLGRLFCGLVLVLAACGGSAAGDDDDTPVDGSGGEPLVNGEPASQYFARFAYATTHTGVEGAAAFPTTADGRNAFLVTFFLLPQGQLQLFYAEGDGEVTSTGYSVNVFGDSKRKRSGQWRVDGAQLVLDSFLRCDGLLFNNSPALRCSLETAIGAPAATGHAGTFRTRISESSPDDSEFGDYVP